MKKFFYLMSLFLCMFAGVAVMTSCGDDDDELGPEDVKSEIKETDNTLQMTIKVGSAYTERYTATFDSNDLCIKFIEEYIYSDSKYADQEWKTIQDSFADMPEVLEKYSRNGKTIVHDDTDSWAGIPRSDVRTYFEMVKEELANQHNYIN